MTQESIYTLVSTCVKASFEFNILPRRIEEFSNLLTIIVDVFSGSYIFPLKVHFNFSNLASTWTEFVFVAFYGW